MFSNDRSRANNWWWATEVKADLCPTACKLTLEKKAVKQSSSSGLRCTDWGQGKSRKVKCSPLRAGQGAAPQQVSLPGTGRERTSSLFPQSLSKVTGLSPTAPTYFLFSPSSLYNTCRVEKLRHQAILLILWRAERSFHIVCSSWTCTLLIHGTSEQLPIPPRVRRSKNKYSNWECMSLVLHKRAKKMYPALEGSEDRGRNQMEK